MIRGITIIRLAGGHSYCFFNGYIHRLAFMGYTDNWVLLSFDVCNEVFHLFTLPNNIKISHSDTVRIDVFRGLLSLFNPVIERENYCDIWVMKEYEPPLFLEILCKSSGKKSRFAAGTKAGFSVSVINRKLDSGSPLALHIEALKEGEEPISFGPDALLVNYGNGWKLQTVTEVDDFSGMEGVRQVSINAASRPGTSFNCLYIKKKLVLAFVVMFMLAGIILFINSYM
ncbi:hypothetical protein CCACVL1_18109 [Corchorus capsularis]|uniref:F-box associated beta-propeller type 3 domain-containing protein n=1 Tax=Corchorus capsularis TaxID=210143 RepID=A0A1R3HMY3_COCAP|nr:hypothetical protein CCACVL1_18109 [Corchorus capsularis]